MPALFAMLLVVSIVAYVVLLPIDLRVYGQNVTGIALFASNVLFWWRAGGTDFYFEPSAHLNPMLHTWSLGVEEQFYLVFPVLLWAVWRMGRRRVLLVLSVLALMSFSFSSVIDGDWGGSRHAYREANFYLLPSRAWELLMGAAVACAAPRSSRAPPRSPWSSIAATLGLAMVLASLATYSTLDYRFPSVFALPATLGTALLLHYGPAGIAGRVLRWRPLVAVGLISYSAYLWHQPLFAFAHYLSLDENLTLSIRWGLSAVSLAVAWVSWRFVESPFRQRHWGSRPVIFGGALVGIATCVIAGVWLGTARRPPMTLRLVSSERLLNTLTTAALPGTAMRDCALGDPNQPGCALNPDSAASPQFLVIGDSHAGALLPAFRRLSVDTRTQGRMIALRLCPPLLDVYAIEEAGCLALQQAAVRYAEMAKVRDVFLVSRWAGYTDGDYRGTMAGYLSQPSWTSPRSREGSRRALIDGLQRSVTAFTSLGMRVHIVAQVPQQEHRPIGIFLQSLLRPDGPDFIRRSSVSQARHQALQAFVSGVFDAYRARSNVSIIDLQDALCRDGVCLVGVPEESYYWDDSHLSTVGALHVSDALIRASGLPRMDEGR